MYLSVCISVRVCDRVTSCVGVNGSVWCVHVAWQPSSFVSCNLDPLHRSDCYGESSSGDRDGEWCGQMWAARINRQPANARIHTQSYRHTRI